MSVLSLWLLFLVMLNPVALFLYLSPIIDEMDNAIFLKIIEKATFIAWTIYALFILTWELIFQKVFQIDFEAFRLFWGIIIFSLAFVFIMGGRESFISMRNSVDDMASQLALPFMVGAWSISVSIIIGNDYMAVPGLLILLAVLTVNALIIISIKAIRDKYFLWAYKGQFKNFLAIIFRLNSFFMGAVGIDMVVSAIKALFL